MQNMSSSKEAMPPKSDTIEANQNQSSSMEPPFVETYKSLFDNSYDTTPEDFLVTEECELPLIDLNRLSGGDEEREECMKEIAKFSQEWGFFQVINHGISGNLLERMRIEQVEVFKRPFKAKLNDENLQFSYRWGTPSATSLSQLSWSEAFHVPLTNHLSKTMQDFGTTVSELAQTLAKILTAKMGHSAAFFKENCLPSTCYIRMNRYPPCPLSPEVFGLVPHTDSDFLTILYPDQIEGLQLVKDGKWIAVKPNPEALIINIGDLFEAWSNGAYKSVKHRVVSSMQVERFSTAYFLCPSTDAVIESCVEPAIYKKFSFKEFRQQVQEDVRNLGRKIGLPRFLV